MSISENEAFALIGEKGTYFEASDGNRIYYYSNANKKDPILFLHTLRTQAEFHHKILPAFIEEYDCYLPDWPGHGRSTKKLNQAYNAQYMVNQIVEFIEAKDLKKIILVGESIGATGVLSLAAKIPERIKSVYASNPYDEGLIIGKPVGRIVSWLGARFSVVNKDEVRPITKFLIGGGFYDRSRLEEKFVDLISNNAKTQENFGAVLHSVLANQKSWHEIRINDYPKIPKDLPVVLLYGEQDWSSKRVREENRKNLGGALEIVTKDKVGHFTFLECPEHVIEIIKTRER